MPANRDRRQKAAERKAAKRKERMRAVARVGAQTAVASTSRASVRAAAHWPLYECLITKDWNKTKDLPDLTQVVVARRSPSGQIGAAIILVDLACLGVKNAFAHVFASREDYEDAVRDTIGRTQAFVRADLDLVARVIREGIAYARKLGFSPHRDYYEAEPFLEGANPDASRVEVPLGSKGKPLYVSGPNDNPRKIIAQLMKAVGEGNFDYVVGMPLPPGLG